MKTRNTLIAGCLGCGVLVASLMLVIGFDHNSRPSTSSPSATRTRSSAPSTPSYRRERPADRKSVVQEPEPPLLGHCRFGMPIARLVASPRTWTQSSRSFGTPTMYALQVQRSGGLSSFSPAVAPSTTANT